MHRVCNVLVERGWAVRDHESRFDLGIRALRLAGRAEELPIVIAFRTVAAEFLTLHDETVCLAVLDGAESLFVALEETSHPVRLVTYVGSKTPAFASASGRVVLASQPTEAVGGDVRRTARSSRRPGRRLNGLPELLSILAQRARERLRRELGGDGRRALRGVGARARTTTAWCSPRSRRCVPTSRITPGAARRDRRRPPRGRRAAVAVRRLAAVVRGSRAL